MNLGRKRSLNTRDKYVLNVVEDSAEHSVVGNLLCLGRAVGWSYKFVVLSAHHDGVDAHRAMSFAVVFHRYLTFRVGAEVGHHLALAAYCSEFDKNLVR